MRRTTKDSGVVLPRAGALAAPWRRFWPEVGRRGRARGGTLAALVVACAAWGTLPARAQYASPSLEVPARSFSWPEGKRAALSLTFDDARLSQVSVGLPLFDRHGVRATFYISPRALEERLPQWKQAVAQGHEIGNHSLTHPCTGNFVWARTNALEDFTLDRMQQELELASAFIVSRLGVKPTSFAYPCGQTFVGRGEGVRSYVPVVARMFRTGRLWLAEEANDPVHGDPAQLLGVELDGKSFAQIRPLLERTLERGRWLVLAGHEIGGGGSQTVLTNTLEQICTFAADPANGLWLDTVDAIARHVLDQPLPRPADR
ncbi:MAG TPA: polysaccharide deacetylase family protein [Verrucomicrobiota bacterium]|nr:polysaccharide deacetylase family protein [Verrucomicrobiota bacterium]HRZ37620.1 polysaccharide deacetylase family protein [Candidatus Paceibacterota bacterium]HRZ56475.1 polysaccharide deacetylase family protein [Candidatus Paceibacterota bacterium]